MSSITAIVISKAKAEEILREHFSCKVRYLFPEGFDLVFANDGSCVLSPSKRKGTATLKSVEKD